MMIRSTALALTQRLVMKTREHFPMEIVAPWRKNHPLTAGLIAQWMRMEFSGLSFRDGYDRKSKKNSSSRSNATTPVGGFDTLGR